MLVRHGEEMCDEVNVRHALRDVEPSASRVVDAHAPSHSETSGKRGKCAFDMK